MRESIAASKRLVDEADAMIRRHRTECEEAEREEDPASDSAGAD